MKRGFFRALVHALVAAQVLLSAPVVSAVAGEGAGNVPMAGMDCADSHDCPCCPDDIGSAAGCLLNCTAGPAMASGFRIAITPQHVEPAADRGFIPNAGSTDPPLKPPPIL